MDFDMYQSQKQINTSYNWSFGCLPQHLSVKYKFAKCVYTEKPSKILIGYMNFDVYQRPKENRLPLSCFIWPCVFFICAGAHFAFLTGFHARPWEQWNS